MSWLHLFIKVIRINASVFGFVFTITSIITIISMSQDDRWSMENIIQTSDLFNPDRPIPLMVICIVIAVIFYMLEKPLAKHEKKSD